MQTRALSLVLFLAAPTLLAQNAPKDYSALNGNWYLTGGWDNVQALDHLVTATIKITGDRLSASVPYRWICGTLSLGNQPEVQGKIAPDGSFFMETPTGYNPSILIKGQVPERGATEWRGSFTMVKIDIPLVQTPCSLPPVDFIARPLPPLDGTYFGSVRDAAGNTIGIEVTMAQGLPTSKDLGQSPDGRFPGLEPVHWVNTYLPLTATISLATDAAGPFPERITAESASTELSSVDGNDYELSFNLKDGSTLGLTGRRNNAAGIKLDATLGYRKDPTHQWSFDGTLTRTQPTPQ